MNEILPIKYIIGLWFLKVIQVCTCVLYDEISFVCVFVVCFFKDLGKSCKFSEALSFLDT